MAAFDDGTRWVSKATGQLVGRPGAVDLATQLRLHIEQAVDILILRDPGRALDDARETIVNSLNLPEGFSFQ